MKQFQILGIDKPCLDETLLAGKIPGANQSVPIGDMSYQGGGKVASALVAAARLGAATGILCKLGKDKVSRFLIDDFRRHQVDVSGIVCTEGASAGYSVVLSDPNGRMILWKAGDGELSADEVDEKKIRAAAVLHICRLGEAERRAVEIAKKNKVLISLDGDFYSPELAAFVGETDIFIGSEEFYQGMFPHTAADYRGNLASVQGPGIVLFTFGSRGGKGVCGKDFFEWNACSKNITVLDTAGAGDVFHGAFLAAYTRGVPPQEAAVYAAAVSALKCCFMGGRAGIPDHGSTVKYLETGEVHSGPMLERTAYYRQAYLNY
jgi:sugar/nucleoside kinase (ribokinase family)